MKTLTTILLLLLATASQAQEPAVTGYLGINFGALNTKASYGMSAGIGVYRAEISGGFIVNKFELATYIGAGYRFNLDAINLSGFSITPKAGMMWFRNAESEMQVTGKKAIYGASVQYHINNAAVVLDVMSNYASLGVRFVTFRNERNNYSRY